MKSIPITDARSHFGTLVNRAGLRGERILLTRNGKPVAAIVPFEDAEYMQKKEDELDVREAERILARREKAIPFEQVQRELGLNAQHRNHTRGKKAARKTA